MEWVQDHLCTEGVLLLDLRRADIDFQSAHIPCAVHSNYYEDGWREVRDGLPNMMPPADRLARLIGSLGIDNQTHVVIYASGTGHFDLAETTSVYFTLRYLGHDLVSILDGGLPAWTAEWDNDIDVGEQATSPRTFIANPKPEWLATLDDVKAVIDAQSASSAPATLVDLRSYDMYLGINRSPALTRHGTLPNALNWPMTWAAQDDTLFIRSPEQQTLLFQTAGIDAETGIIMFCNSGLESSVGWFVAHALLGFEDVRIYDGSLAEWTREPTLPLDVKVPVN